MAQLPIVRRTEKLREIIALLKSRKIVYLSAFFYAKIASILNISERTVRYYCGLIYQKLGVSTRAEALNKSAELGDI